MFMKKFKKTKYTGIIEGFYGTPWTHQNRLSAIEFLKENNLNTYIYAPKNDPYHRDNWRAPYPPKEKKQLLELVEKAKECGVEFVYCISPGKDIDIKDETELDKIVEKLLSLDKNNLHSYALLMDDINYSLSNEAKKKYPSPGVAHARLANKVYIKLKKEINDLNFFVCPTEYWQNWDSPYRQDLNAYLNQDIIVFYTGYNTIAKSITNEDIACAYEIFGHKLAIWDNYPTNDANKDRLYLGPLLHRSSELDSHFVTCYVMNPMNQWEMNRFALMTAAKYLDDPKNYDPYASLDEAVSKTSELWKIDYEYLNLFVRLNQSSRLQEYRFSELIEAIDSKSNLSFWISKLQKCHEKICLLPESVFSEIKPWIDKFHTEIEYLIAYEKGMYILNYESQYNLGFNFGSYAQRKIGGQDE